MQAPKTIFGRQLRRFAHQADVLRLELLQQWGGVYMDMDILVLSPLDELHRHGAVLAIAVLTMAALAMAVLAMAVLAMAILTMAVLY